MPKGMDGHWDFFRVSLGFPAVVVSSVSVALTAGCCQKQCGLLHRQCDAQTALYSWQNSSVVQRPCKLR